MKKHLLYSIFGLTLLSFGAQAQRSPLSNFYLYNRIMINPAATGDEGHFNAFLLHRASNTGINGAAVNQYLTLHAPVTKTMNMGLVMLNQEEGIIKRTSANLNYSYNLKIFNDHALSFGVAAGIFQNRINFNELVVENPAEYGLYANSINAIKFNADFGIKYQWDNLEVHVAFPNLVPNKSQRVTMNDPSFFQSNTQFNGMVSYKYKTTDKLTLQPAVMVRSITNGGFYHEYMLNFNYKGVGWAAVGYRNKNGFIFNAGTNIFKNLGVFYSYDFFNNTLGMQSFGSHEIGLSFNFSKDGSSLFEALENDTAAAKKDDGMQKLIEAVKEEKAAKRKEQQAWREKQLKLKEERIKARTARKQQTIIIQSDQLPNSGKDVNININSPAKVDSKLEGNNTIDITLDGYDMASNAGLEKKLDSLFAIMAANGSGAGQADLEKIRQDLSVLKLQLPQNAEIDKRNQMMREDFNAALAKMAQRVDAVEKNTAAGIASKNAMSEDDNAAIKQLREDLYRLKNEVQTPKIEVSNLAGSSAKDIEFALDFLRYEIVDLKKKVEVNEDLSTENKSKIDDLQNNLARLSSEFKIADKGSVQSEEMNAFGTELNIIKADIEILKEINSRNEAFKNELSQSNSKADYDKLLSDLKAQFAQVANNGSSSISAEDKAAKTAAISTEIISVEKELSDLQNNKNAADAAAKKLVLENKLRKLNRDIANLRTLDEVDVAYNDQLSSSIVNNYQNYFNSQLRASDNVEVYQRLLNENKLQLEAAEKIDKIKMSQPEMEKVNLAKRQIKDLELELAAIDPNATDEATLNKKIELERKLRKLNGDVAKIGHLVEDDSDFRDLLSNSITKTGISKSSSTVDNSANNEEIAALKNDVDRLNKELAMLKEALKGAGTVDLSSIEAKLTKKIEKEIEAKYVSVTSKTNDKGEVELTKSNLQEGYYIVINSERKYEDILHAQKELARQGIETQVVQNVRKTWYHLFTTTLPTRQEAGKAVGDIREKGFSDAWWLLIE